MVLDEQILILTTIVQLKMRGKKARVDGDSGEIDNAFWAQAAADQARARNADDMDEDGNNPDIPFNTQFFNDDFDDGFDADGVTVGPSVLDADAGEQDLLAATAGQTRKVKPEFVNYAKRAKRVDVRKLKENIWKGLDIIVVDDEENGDMVRFPVQHFRIPVTWLRRMWTTKTQLHGGGQNHKNLLLILQKRANLAKSLADCRNRTLATSWKKSAPVSASFVFCIWRTSKVLNWKPLPLVLRRRVPKIPI